MANEFREVAEQMVDDARSNSASTWVVDLVARAMEMAADEAVKYCGYKNKLALTVVAARVKGRIEHEQ